MPRKSANQVATEAIALAAAFPADHERPPPPEGLAPAAAAIWRDVVLSMRPGWFSRETNEQLARYCNAMVECCRLEAALADLGVGSTNYGRLARQLNSAARRALDFAKALRIAPATNRESMSKIDARDPRRSLHPKPWEVDGDGDGGGSAAAHHPAPEAAAATSGRPWED